MTTLKELLEDLVEEVVHIVVEHPSAEEGAVFLDEDEKEALIDKYIEIVLQRLIGYE